MGSTSRRDRSTTSSFDVVLAAGLILAGCGPASHNVDPTKVEAFGSGSGNAASRIEVRDVAGHPRLATVRRDGDATGAVAVIGNVVGPREALSLAVVFEERLADAGFTARKRVDRASFALGFYTTDPASVMGALRSALAKPIGDGDVSRLEAKLASAHVPPDETFLAATSACEGDLALPKSWKHLTAAELEKARRDVFGTAALVLGAVGDSGFLDATTKAVASSDAFPAGAAPSAQAWPSQRAANAGRIDGVVEGGSEIRVALSIPDPRGAVSIAKMFEGDAGAALRAKLARLSVPFAVERVSGVAHAKGGCLAVRLKSAAPATDDAMIDATLAAESIAERDLGALAVDAADPDVASASVLDASDPIEAAELAAWWSGSTSMSGASQQASIAVALSPKASDASVSRVQAGIATPATRTESEAIQLVTRNEVGQGELWMLLANPCAASSESQHQWGASASAVVARAAVEPRDGVTLEPLVAPEAVGIVAHAAARKGETGDDLARRVAGRAAQALLGGPPSADDLLRAVGHARRVLERDWGRETLGLDAFASAMSPDRPAAFEPFGSFAGLTKSDVARGVAAWQVVARGPLRLAVLANESASQGPAALAATSRWVLPGPVTRCPADAPGEPRAGHDEVHADQEKGRGLAHVFIGLPLGKGADARQVGDVLRALFDGPASIADAAVHGMEQTKVSARIVGAPPALAVVIEAPEDHLPDAEKAVTDLLFRVGRAEVTDDIVTRAIAESFTDAERRWSDPRQRALALATGHDPAASFAPAHVDLARFRAWARTAAADGRLTVVEAHR